MAPFWAPKRFPKLSKEQPKTKIGFLQLSWTSLGPLLGHSWPLLGSLGHSWASLGPLLASLAPLLSSLGPLLAASWALFGSLGPLLGFSWTLLGLSWGVLGHSWLFCPSLGLSWASLKALLGLSWPPLGLSWASLGAPRGVQKGSQKGAPKKSALEPFFCEFWGPLFGPVFYRLLAASWAPKVAQEAARRHLQAPKSAQKPCVFFVFFAHRLFRRFDASSCLLVALFGANLASPGATLESQKVPKNYPKLVPKRD